MTEVRSDPKPTPRIKDPAAVRRKVRADGSCRCGCGRRATDGHHVLPRSLSGDDVAGNIVGMFHDCHMLLEHDGGENGKAVRVAVGENLRQEEVEYLVGKRGRDGGLDFLRRYYGVEPTWVPA